MPQINQLRDREVSFGSQFSPSVGWLPVWGPWWLSHASQEQVLVVGETGNWREACRGSCFQGREDLLELLQNLLPPNTGTQDLATWAFGDRPIQTVAAFWLLNWIGVAIRTKWSSMCKQAGLCGHIANPSFHPSSIEGFHGNLREWAMVFNFYNLSQSCPEFFRWTFLYKACSRSPGL